jgi:hypothetical protein
MKQARKLASHIYTYTKSEAKGNMLPIIKNTGRQLPREKTKKYHIG